jgi:predicted nicotinamide N-methyase
MSEQDYSERLNQHLQMTLNKGRVNISYPAGCPEIALYLFDPAVLQGPLSHEEAQAVVAEPAYWSFCWASGQVLAQYILEHPSLVRNKTVVDFGSGSGVVAIAAAKAGAAKVYACDIDAQARDAAKANAMLNQVEVDTIKDVESLDPNQSIDMILAADVLYDKDNHPLLDYFVSLAPEVILADSRVRQLPSSDYRLHTTVSARTWPDLNEFEEFNQVRIYFSVSAR